MKRLRAASITPCHELAPSPPRIPHGLSFSPSESCCGGAEDAQRGPPGNQEGKRCDGNDDAAAPSMQVATNRECVESLSFSHFRCPTVDTLASPTNLQPLDLESLHAGRVVQPGVPGHTPGIGALLRNQLQHGRQEV